MKRKLYLSNLTDKQWAILAQLQTQLIEDLLDISHMKEPVEPEELVRAIAKLCLHN